MAPIMALKPVIRANAKTDPDQTCFCLLLLCVKRVKKSQSVVSSSHISREREKKRKNTRHKVLMMTMKKDKSL